MTQVMQHEFKDETGLKRNLCRDEIVTYLTLITAAGSDTTATAIGWAGSLLSDHLDQRRELVDDPGLIAQAFEELLRFEQPSYHYCRWTTKDSEFHGQTVPADKVLVMIPGSANRDETTWEDPERFDIHRKAGPGLHLQLRPPLLPRRQPRQDRRPHCAGNPAGSDPRVDGRLRRGGADRRHRHSWVGGAPGGGGVAARRHGSSSGVAPRRDTVSEPVWVTHWHRQKPSGSAGIPDARLLRGMP